MPPSSNLPTTHVRTIHTHTAPVNYLSFSNSGGTYIVSGSSDRQIHLSRSEPSPNTSSSIPATTQKPIQRYTSHGYAVLDISVTADNTKFASGSGDRSGPFLWDINIHDSTIRRFGSNSSSPHTSRITCVQFTAEDNVLASGSDDRSVRLWDCKSRDSRPLMVLEDAKDGVSALWCWDKEVIAGSTDGRVRSYDVRMGRCVVDVQPGPVTSLSVSRDGRTVLVGCLDGKLRLTDRENGGCLRTFPPEGKMGPEEGGYKNESLRLHSTLALNDSIVLSGSEADGRVRGWDVLSGKQAASIEVSETGKVISVVKWREGSEVESRRGVWAAGGADGVVRIYG